MNIYEISYYCEDYYLIAVVIAGTEEEAIACLTRNTSVEELSKIKLLGTTLSSEEKTRVIVNETL